MKSKSLTQAELMVKIAEYGQQFKNLNPNDPAAWPLLPRIALCSCIVIGVIVLGWFSFLSTSDDELQAEQGKEVQFRTEYTEKLTQAINIDALRKQREEVQQFVLQLEKQLPGKAEMDALLSDINQAGLGRSLQFELFRPGQVVVKEYYAELPIAIKITGKYHDMGAFAADISQLSRIVTLNNIILAPVKDGTLSMEAVAKTFRYLDPEEVVMQKKNMKPASAK
jgi:type IV pilus assembly protein PilO